MESVGYNLESYLVRTRLLPCFPTGRKEHLSSDVFMLPEKVISSIGSNEVRNLSQLDLLTGDWQLHHKRVEMTEVSDVAWK